MTFLAHLRAPLLASLIAAVAAPVIAITDGSGYAGSTYTVTNGGTGKWQDGTTDIPSATSSTYVMPLAREGAALSWLRSDGVRSNVIEMWVPTDYPSLVAWWDAALTSTLTLDGSNNVSAWADRISSISASQATAGSRPGYVASARNGKPGLSFNGSNSQLSFSPANLPAGDVTVMVLGYFNQAATSGDWRRLFCYGEAADNNKGIQIIRQGSSKTACEITASPGNSDWAMTDRMIMLSKAGATGSLFVDGSDAIKTATFAATLERTTGYIGRGLQFADLWPGSCQQILVAGSAGDVTARRALQGWTSWRNGLAGANLPAGHPHKSAPPRIQ